jgi:hypothetical protein
MMEEFAAWQLPYMIASHVRDLGEVQRKHARLARMKIKAEALKERMGLLTR